MTDEKSNNIWMPLNWLEYLKDTSKLTLEQHGAYFMLIKEYWHNEGAIEDDFNGLCRACFAFDEKERQAISFCLAKYFKYSNGYWFHKRIDKELSKAIVLKKKKSEAGKKGMASRYNKDTNSVITELVTDGLTKPLTESNQLQLQSQLQDSKDTHTPISKLNFNDFTDEQKAYFKEKAPDVDIPDLIDTMQNWCAAKGKRYENYYRALQDWAKKEQAKINLTKKKEGRYENNGANNQGNGGQVRAGGKPTVTDAVRAVDEAIARGEF